MYVLDGQWYMQGLDRDDEGCIRSSGELLSVIESVGFLPLFSNNVAGFSVEEMTAVSDWWSSDEYVDPWEWRAVLARTDKVAYGKFFGGRAGFISKKWFPYFANYRRDGYDFDARYEDGKAGYREKLLMDLFVPEGVDMWGVKTEKLEDLGVASSLYTHEMKDRGGFGKGGEKNFEGTLTKLQMQTYLIVKDFKPRLNKRGEEYGWAVAVMMPPEYKWGYKHVASRYNEKPSESYSKIVAKIGKHFECDAKMLKGVI